ncbi:DMT family transporter [Bosea sp. BIWAKO-01]|uniref:DMT family transporter n=1 Tax=Bosea sp. BIWAKO-01 TaxID=506668 RepID=UPI00086E5914|nr:DMT family transporter [Bosea sp. BIWAKO-01]GAU85870.1 permease of the drug/metabolite transporter DMT superfamily [Bosea sp. BIWAKO-01]
MRNAMLGDGAGGKGLAILAGAAFVAITTLQFVAARFSLREHLTAADIVSLRFLGAGLVFLPVLWTTGTGKLRALGWRRAALLALLAGLPYPLIINQGLTQAPAAHAAALSPASIVFFSFVLSRIAFKETVSGARLIGIGIIMAGLALFVFHAGLSAGDTWRGDLLFAGSGVMFSAYAVLARLWSVDAVTATIAVVLVSCLPLPLLHALAPSGLGAASLAEIITQVVVQGFLAGAAAIVLYTYVVRQLGPQPASLFMPCIPVTTVLTGMVVLGEIPTPPQFVAIAVITCGMVFPILRRA